MLSGLVDLIIATIKLIWQIISHPAIIIVLSIITTTILMLSGFAFFTVYGGMIALLFVFGILSIWIIPLRHIFAFLLVVGALFYLGGKIFPPMDSYITKTFPAYTEWRNDEKKLVNNKLGERSIDIKKELLSSEVSKGTFGCLTENSLAYDETGATIPDVHFQKGQRIMSLGLQGKSQVEDPAGAGTEGLVYVLIANEAGDFVKSRSVLVPIRKIKWNTEKAVNKKVVVKTVTEEKILVADLPNALRIGFVHPNGRNHYHLVESLSRDATTVIILTVTGIKYTGRSTDGNLYRGSWYYEDNSYGGFTLKFSDKYVAHGKLQQQDGQYDLALIP